MAGELIKVQFHGDTLDAMQDDNGTVWVSLRRCCENLGVDVEVQRRKLKGKAWACAVEMTAQMPGSDQGRELTMIDLDTLPGWLFSIDARKVAEHVREKLARYQREAAKVLANHFLRKPKEPGLGAEQLRDLVTTIVAESLMPFLAQLRAATAAPPMPIYPRATIRERLLWKNWPEASGSDRKKVHKLACALIDANLLETPVQAGGPGGGGPLYFFGAQLAFLDEAIDRVREAKQRRERAAGPHLFSAVA